MSTLRRHGIGPATCLAVILGLLHALIRGLS